MTAAGNDAAVDGIPPSGPLRRRFGRTAAVVLVCGVLLGGISVAVLTWSGRDDDRLALVGADASSEPTVDVTIPAGTGERLDRGEPVSVLPRRLVVNVGDTIRIENQDDRAHLAGPFYIGAGETLRQTFANAGEITGACSAHPDGQITIVVRP
ncbi:MAG: hypothetical protein ACK5OX_15670 [Desertimonas sp.]